MHRYKNALILGHGRSGQAAESLLLSEGTAVAVLCEKATPDYCFENLPFHPEIAVVSPGFSLEHPWVKDLVERGIPLLSEIELGWSRRQCPVIAVTGSNGKSTVVKWIAEALACAGQTAVPCGNYGDPVCAAVMRPGAVDWLVIEVSSFQLETVQEFRPDIGVLLNVLPNHLDRHGSMDAYRDLKLRLFEKMGADDVAVMPCDLFNDIKRSLPSFVPQHLNCWKTFGPETAADFVYADGTVRGGSQQIDLRGTRFDNEILGPAAAAVVAVTAACHLPMGVVEASARDFDPLPHRMEPVAEINGIRFIDDSKATNLAAMCAAVKMCKGRIHLIAGGRAKEKDLSFAKDLLAQRVTRLYLIGEASEAMLASWDKVVTCTPCGTLEKAVSNAWGQAGSGDVVLLSPACTSFDQFSSFNERGEIFARAVKQLI